MSIRMTNNQDEAEMLNIRIVAYHVTVYEGSNSVGFGCFFMVSNNVEALEGSF